MNYARTFQRRVKRCGMGEGCNELYPYNAALVERCGVGKGVEWWTLTNEDERCGVGYRV